MQITTCTSVSYIQSAICKPVKDVIGLEHDDMRHKEPFDGVRSAYFGACSLSFSYSGRAFQSDTLGIRAVALRTVVL